MLHNKLTKKVNKIIMKQLILLKNSVVICYIVSHSLTTDIVCPKFLHKQKSKQTTDYLFWFLKREWIFSCLIQSFHSHFWMVFSHMFVIYTLNFKKHGAVITTYCITRFHSMNCCFVSFQNKTIANILWANITFHAWMYITYVIFQSSDFSKCSVTLITFIGSYSFMFGSDMFRQNCSEKRKGQK